MAGHLIRRLHQISASVFGARTRAAGFELTAVQFAALSAAAHHPGADQATIAGLIAYDRVTIGDVIARLEGRGLVRREVSRADRRARRVWLTAAGEAALRDLAPLVAAFQDEILTGLDAAERAEFLRLAAKAARAGNHLSRAPQAPPRGDPTESG